jgi:hypothetical protein
MDRADIDKAIREKIRSGEKVLLVGGAFGDLVGCGGYTEWARDGRTKYFGCSAIWDGETRNEVIDSVAVVKRVIMASVRLLVRPWRVKEWFLSIYEADLEQKEVIFNPAFKELVRSLATVIDKRLAECLGKIFQSDPAYGLMLRDAIDNDPIKMLDTLIDRQVLFPNYKTAFYPGERPPIGEWGSTMRDKLVLIRRLMKIALKIPKIKRMSDKFFKDLDTNKVRLDDNAWYFCLRREGYNFGGLTIKDRLELAEKIDQRDNNVFLGI